MIGNSQYIPPWLRPLQFNHLYAVRKPVGTLAGLALDVDDTHRVRDREGEAEEDLGVHGCDLRAFAAVRGRCPGFV